MIGEADAKEQMIVITGAMGFIGSCLASALANTGVSNLLLVDDFTPEQKLKNLQNISSFKKMNRMDFLQSLKNNDPINIRYIIHIGARTDTTEFKTSIFDELNLNYSKVIWKYCAEKNIPLIYASSAATYGNGDMGYNDDHRSIQKLKPLNPYGESKNEFDKWALQQKTSPPYWYGLKFFNVYGPNEYHKNRMASVIFHAYNQLKQTGKVKLFRSHKSEFKDGEQLRDFIYVKDVVDIIKWLMHSNTYSGIYNLGTGKARTFYDLAKSTAYAMHIPLQIEWINIPEDIRETYQYFTEANMDKIRAAGYGQAFYDLEAGINNYVKEYLITSSNF